MTSMLRSGRIAAATAILALASGAGGHAEEPLAGDIVERGRALVVQNCSGCHAIGESDESLHVNAPRFRELEERFPVDALEETFVGSIDTGHPGMPVFTGSQDQIDAIVAYIASIMH